MDACPSSWLWQVENPKDKPNTYEYHRLLLPRLMEEQHKEHPSHGHHMLAQGVFDAMGCFLIILPIHAANRTVSVHRRKNTHIKRMGRTYSIPHVIAGNWNVNHPVGFVVSDMTIFKNGIKMRNGHCGSIHLTIVLGNPSPSRGCFHIDSSAYV